MPRTRLFFRRHHTNMINVVLIVVAGVWLCFQLWVKPTDQPPVLNLVLQATFGAWLTNLAYEQRHRDERVESRLDNIEAVSNIQDRRVNQLEAVATTEHPDVAEQEHIPRHEQRADDEEPAGTEP